MDPAPFVVFLIFFIPLFFLSKYKPKIPWILIFCVIGIIFGVIIEATDSKEKGWAPDLLSDIYPNMSTKLVIFDHFDMKHKDWDMSGDGESTFTSKTLPIGLLCV